MITEEKMLKIYEGLIENEELTTKKLNEYGFNQNEINVLIKNKKVFRKKRGSYVFFCADDLYNYGKELLLNGYYDKAGKCFQICNDIDPENYESCFQLFRICIINEEYSKALKYFDILYNSGIHQNDVNYYLLLLSMVIDLPDKYKLIAKNFEFADIKLSEEYEDFELQNKIRSFAMGQKFGSALLKIDELSDNDMAMKSLLFEAKRIQSLRKEYIKKLIDNNDYNEIINTLELEKNQHNLNFFNDAILDITNRILDIISTGFIPKPDIFETDSIYEAIRGKNYKLALNNSKNNTSNINLNHNILFILLTQLNDLINKRMAKRNIVKKQKKETIDSNVTSNASMLREKNVQFINNKIQQVYKNDIILLKINSELLEDMHEMVSNISDVGMVKFEYNSTKYAVLIFKTNLRINWKCIAKEGNQAYSLQDYNLCIDNYKKILKSGIYMAWVFAKIGLAYMKLGEFDLAINYLTIATGLSIKENSDFDFSQLIDSLKGQISQEDKKPRIAMKIEDFNDNLNDDYETYKFNEILNMLQAGIKLDEACDILKLSVEEKKVIYLLLARKNYSEKKYTAGDYYLSCVEKVRNNPSFVKKLLNEVKTKKKFYGNRL